MEKQSISILSRFLYARNFVSAREAIIRGRYEAAQKHVNMLFAAYKAEIPSVAAPIHANIMAALVAWNLKRFSKSYSACRISLNQIDEMLKSFPEDSLRHELLYLQGYCKNLVAFTEAEGGDKSEFDFRDIDTLKAPAFDRALVNDLVKRTFPLEDTKWWDQSK